jgi:hypothetical protein
VIELGGRRIVVKTLSSRTKRFRKFLFALSWCRIPKAKGSGDLLSRSPMHTGAWDEEGYSGGVAARIGKSLGRLDVFSGGDRWVIYREVKQTSCRVSNLNRLGLEFRIPYLADLKIKSPKIKTAKESHIPARLEVGFWQTIHAGAARPCSSPCPVWPCSNPGR